MITRISFTIASSILRTLSAWRSSRDARLSLLSLVTPSTQRDTSSPNAALHIGHRCRGVFDHVMQQPGLTMHVISMCMSHNCRVTSSGWTMNGSPVALFCAPWRSWANWKARREGIHLFAGTLLFHALFQVLEEALHRAVRGRHHFHRFCGLHGGSGQGLGRIGHATSLVYLTSSRTMEIHGKQRTRKTRSATPKDGAFPKHNTLRAHGLARQTPAGLLRYDGLGLLVGRLGLALAGIQCLPEPRIGDFESASRIRPCCRTGRRVRESAGSCTPSRRRRLYRCRAPFAGPASLRR